ncbi:copper resistance CopC family protein [Aeromicrobium alkaliterrae]|uniref:CopC domain-containing protein n=1 Tax=Aeromicrobium alkaliterrae TaxID=302168 RepID=A0ABP4VSG2_9ACTN
MSSTTRWIARAAALVVCATLLLPLPASAHDALIESTPAAGAQVGAGDEGAVSFRFNNDVLATAAFIAVLDPQGADVSSADVVIAGDTVSRTYTPSTAGTYTASYRVTSSDGHPIEGSITFTHEGRPDTESAAPDASDRGESDENAARDDQSTSSGGDGSAVMLGIAAALVLTLLVLGVVRRIRRGRSTS